MESEKVKEIKKALKHCGNKITCQGCPEYNNEPVIDWFECKKTLFQKTITLINKLESENERLTKQYVDWKDLYYENTKRVKKLKDRIAELEKQLSNDRVFYKDGICYPMNCQGALKQFATLLKVKTVLTPSGWCVNIEDIDETLKEFTNEQKM